MKCKLSPNDYHMPCKSRFKFELIDCQCQVANTITGSIPYQLYKDIEEINGLQAAKDAWWDFYKWLNEQETLQDNNI